MAVPSLVYGYDWQASISDTEGDDTPIRVYADFLDDYGDFACSKLAAFLRDWMDNRTIIRTLHSAEDCQTDFEKQLFDLNQEFPAPETEIIEARKAWMSARIGGCYTHLHATAEYIRKRPNLLSSQPFRSLTLIASRATEEDLEEVFTNWRMYKFWSIDMAYYQYWGGGEEKLLQMIRRMKPLGCGYLNIRGVRNINFKISSSLIGLKKIPKGCRLKLGAAKEIVA